MGAQIRLLSIVLAISVACWLTPSFAQDVGRDDFLANCGACHSTIDGDHRFGPSLFGIIGKTAGTIQGFVSSSSYVAAGQNGVVWEQASLDKFLERPPVFLGQHAPPPIVNRMPVRVANPELRKKIISYLVALEGTEVKK